MKTRAYVLLLLLCILYCSVRAQWVQVNSGLPIGPIVQGLASNGSALYAGGYGDMITPLLHRSTDNGASWTAAYSGIRWIQFQYDSLWPAVRTLASTGSTVFAVAYPCLYVSNRDTLPWRCVADTSVSGAFTALDSVTILVVGRNKLSRTTNQGIVWDSIGSSPDARLNRMCSIDSVVLAGMTDYLSAGLYRSSNLGATWQIVRTGLPDSVYVNDFHKVGKYIFLAGGDNSSPNSPTPFVARSSDTGRTWITMRTGLPNPSSAIALSSIDSTIFLGTGSYSYGGSGVYRSINYGETWENVSGNLTTDAIAIISLCVHGGFVFAGAPWTGVWRRPLSELFVPIQLASFTGRYVGGARVLLDWTTISEINNYGFYVQRRRESETEFTEISQLILGHGTTNEPQHYSWTDSNATINRWYYRLKQVDLDGTVHLTEPIIVDVVTSVAESSPIEYSLHQNYPNPFNPSTTIKYDLPEPVKVSLVVYDVLGRKVDELVNGFKEAGYHFATWNAKDVSSGVYFARFTATDANGNLKLLKVNKLLLAK